MKVKPIVIDQQTLMKAVHDVLDNLDSDTQAAMRSIKSKQEFIPALHSIIQERLVRFNVSIGTILRNSEASPLFLQRDRLKAVADYHNLLKRQYAKQDHQAGNEAQNRVVITAQKVFEKRDLFWSTAQDLKVRTEKADHDNADIFFFYLIVRGYLKSKNTTIDEILQNEEARKFFSSGRLLKATIVHMIYSAKAAQQQQGESNHAQDHFFDKHAKQLAQQHAKQPGLLTQLDARGIEDEQKLRQRVKEVQLINHPDKNNEEADPKILFAANEVANLMKRGVLKDYLDALRVERNKADAIDQLNGMK